MRTELFSSDTKHDSHCGWSSFYDILNEGSMVLIEDKRYGMTRTEVVCFRCVGHLGHLFDDGLKFTGQHYCINSIALDFKKKGK